jgi:ATP-binding cassette subfamily A (ABC1) protein 3
VTEHFELYLRLKNQKWTELDLKKMIKEVDLEDYTNVLAQNLSGGNKRKL